MSIAIYAGSFDPFTLGHFSVLKQAAAMFSNVRILVAHNPNKKSTFKPGLKLKIIDEYIKKIPNIDADHHDGYVIDYAKEIGAKYLIRGIRNETDAAYELDISKINKEKAPEIQTIFFPTSEEVANVSSTKTKEFLKEFLIRYHKDVRFFSSENEKSLCYEPLKKFLPISVIQMLHGYQHLFMDYSK